MMRLILSRPDVSFRYISQVQTLYHSAGDGKLSPPCSACMGRKSAPCRRSRPKARAGPCMAMSAQVTASGHRAHQSFFINGRYMKSAFFQPAWNLLPCSARCRPYPSCILQLTMPFEMVDVTSIRISWSAVPERCCIAEAMEASSGWRSVTEAPRYAPGHAACSVGADKTLPCDCEKAGCSRFCPRRPHPSPLRGNLPAEKTTARQSLPRFPERPRLPLKLFPPKPPYPLRESPPLPAQHRYRRYRR